MELKNAMTKSNTKALTKVAVAMAANTYMKERVDDYVQHLPSMMEKGPLMAKQIQELQHVQRSEAGLRTTFDVLQGFDALRRCMRAGSTQPLEQLLRDSVDKLFDWIMTAPDGQTQAGLTLTQQMLQEAAIVWPMQEDLQDKSNRLAGLLRNRTADKQVKELSENLKSVKQALGKTDIDTVELSEALGYVQASLDTNQVEPKSLPGVIIEDMRTILEAVLQRVDSN